MSEKRPDWRSALKAVVDERRRDLGPHPGLDEIEAYHAGELEASGAKRLQDHLVLCPQCARLLLELDAFAADAAAVASEPPMATVVPIARYRAARQWRWAAAGGLAAAAALVLLVAWPRDEPLPGYDMDLSGGSKSVRAVETDPEGETSVFVTGSRLALKLQPETAVTGPVTARAYLRRGDELRALSASTLEVRGDGVVSLEGIVGTDLLLPVGESELVMAVARPAALPSRSRLEDELAHDEAPRGKRWIGFKQEIRVLEPNAGTPDAGAPAADEEGPWVEYAGCRTIVIGPICILRDDRRLTLWVRHHRAEEIRIEAGSLKKSYAATEIQDGYRYEIEVGKWTTEVVVEVHQEEKRSIWALEVRHDPAPDWLVKARELFDRKEWDAARRLLEPLKSAVDPVERGSTLSVLARIERRSGHAELGDEYYRRAIAAHREAGRLFDQIRDAAGLTYYLIQEKRFSEARELLDSLPVDATGGSAESRNSVAYQRGLLAEETGDFRAALEWMARAAREAERAGLSRKQIFAQDLLARQLHTVGLVDAAAALYSRMQPLMATLCGSASETSELNACDCARFAVNRAWVGLLALEAGRPADGPDPSTLLDDAERIFEEEARGEGTCVSPDDLPNVRLNRALAALHGRDTAEARRYLDRARVDAEESPSLALWQLDVEARIWLAEAQPGRALDRYEELGRRAAESSSPEAGWRAAFGRATAFELVGRTGEAIQSCAQAEDLLDQESLLVPMHAGRERFIAQRERAARFCLDLLLRADREDEALAGARRSAARALRNLRAGARIAELEETDRDQWQRAVYSYRETRAEIEELAARIWKGLPRDEEERLEAVIEGKRQALRGLLDRFASLAGSSASAAREPAPPAPETMLLAYHPLPRGWAAFAADEEGVTARRVEPIGEIPMEARSEEELSSLLLEPFADKILRATEVQVIAYGALRDVDFHALPFAGGILLGHAPVVYRLDLPDPPDEALASSVALVVSGPGLLEAPDEAREARSALESRPGVWRVELLESGLASGHEVRRRLPDATLFHYAGHADYDEDSRGWDSHLALAGGGRLTVDDVLALPRGPRWVVLSGCETGRDSRTAPLPSIGLAQAFLVAGSEAVVAATADVEDRHAAALMEGVYRHWDASTRLAVALRQAQLELRDRAGESGWQKFRILSR